LFGRLERDRKEVASLTKLMTLYSVYRLCDVLKINMNEELVVIDEETTQVTGTTANLKRGDTLSVDQLIYGLMLPSGNDAAFALAQHFGRIIMNLKKEAS
jgi:D-alanyl-D-alanine carboxypeptidase